ncbi:hypothetical protein BCR37DRAFT_392227 [Protomyces lactucae-debilis]|uniref:Uncharacterized protein n=1 Tax=Protomyces lactucae-debilis TaxID=2754530 RepID=A0A1Y2FIK4_PROLT|nr:uncharacterized protein BCR37DRAFT_392227 [Protomyces lactucae-debilis]ORY83768.1 hypothetical protein BCR37DRAFT_392227 [Protomyces lactucae-debilis]
MSPDISEIGRLVMTLTTPDRSDGEESVPWTEQLVVLEGLRPNWHYEIRLCWPATMPTAFDLRVLDDLGVHHHLNTKPTLLHANMTKATTHRYLLIKARPDFVTPQKLSSAPAVTFELILDPLAFGVLPKSLLPVLGWLALAILVGLNLVLPLIHALLDEIVHGQRQKMVRIKSQ